MSALTYISRNYFIKFTLSFEEIVSHRIVTEYKHRRMGRGGRGRGELQPAQNLGNLDFLGSERNLGKANF